VTRRLGRVRELDVQIGLINDLRKTTPCSGAGCRPLKGIAEEARDAARRRMSKRLPASKLERLARALRRLSEDLGSGDAGCRKTTIPPDRDIVRALEAQVAHRAARVRMRVEEAGTRYVPDQLHAVRIAVKQLRYAAELLAEVTHRPMATDIATLKAAQELLGHFHDLDVLLVRAREARASLLASNHVMSQERLDSVVHVLEDRCRQIHARYLCKRARLMLVTNRMGAAPPKSRQIGDRAVA
jgi:CHAD domain-containing protein